MTAALLQLRTLVWPWNPM